VHKPTPTVPTATYAQRCIPVAAGAKRTTDAGAPTMSSARA